MDCLCAVLTWLNLWVCRALASPLLSPVCFDSFDIAHQVLSKTDPKDLKRKERSTLGQQMSAEHELRTTENPAHCCTAEGCGRYPLSPLGVTDGPNQPYCHF